jgi:ribosome recycling factor
MNSIFTFKHIVMNQEEVQFYLDETKERMEAALHHLETELGKIRAGRANPKVLQDVMVDYYGSLTPLAQVANIAAPDPRTIAVQPWDKKMIPVIERAIMNANLGFNPDNNGEVIRVNVPALTEERRRDLVKQSKGEAETAKVSVRNARRDVIEQVKKMVKEGLAEDLAKDAEASAQKLTDEFGKRVDEHLAKKEKDIMTI